MKIISACLLGIKCRCDNKSKPNKKVIGLFKKGGLIPICPEQFGGLSTPREPAEQRGEKVFTKSGKDVTKNFMNGANEILRLTKLLNIKEAILKARSPSCGCGEIYDGTFTNTLVNGDGVTTTLLKKNGINVLTEEDL